MWGKGGAEVEDARLHGAELRMSFGNWEDVFLRLYLRPPGSNSSLLNPRLQICQISHSKFESSIDHSSPVTLRAFNRLPVAAGCPYV
ncbi:hypothetical protein E3N88_13319 [Mikania micrantha]|uniref:Uncharacterized protein n=1 Tax=Mikania micrantha TaxID=192012 RepID=A0A5N6P852_9ASTR|nr:hypothetical protein E3N88_13319 [Mikania micrantha]